MGRDRSRYQFAGVVVVLAGLGFALFLTHRSGTNEPPAASAPASAAVATSSAAKANATTQPRVLAADSSSRPSPGPASAATEGFHHQYFERTLLGRPLVAKIYQDWRPKLGPGEAADLIAIYLAEGPAREGSPDFARFMSALHRAIEEHSQAISDLLNANESAFRQDPFVYQMALNLAFNLNLPTEEKARFLGKGLNTHFAADEQTGVSMMTANITNALILMKNAGVTLEQARPYIQRGVALNSDNAEALTEFAARVNAYYPGAI